MITVFKNGELHYKNKIYKCALGRNGIKKDKMEDVFVKLYKFLKLYNNNYRPIYHLESFIFYLCIKIHGL